MPMALVQQTRKTEQLTDLCINPLRALVGVFNTAIKVDGDGVLRTSLLPWVSKAQPIIRLLNLINQNKLNYC